ncbi:aldehyde dehydrogenase, partial [Natrinema soli]
MQAEYYDRERYDVGDSVLERHRSAAETVLSHDRYGHLIDGDWVDAADGEEGRAIDATTGEALA